MNTRPRVIKMENRADIEPSISNGDSNNIRGLNGVTYEKARQAKSHTPPPGQSVKVSLRTNSRFQSPIRALLAHYTVGYRPLIQISRALPIRVSHDPRETAGLFPDEGSFSCEHRIDDLQHLPGYRYPGSVLSVFVRYPPIEVLHPWRAIDEVM